MNTNSGFTVNTLRKTRQLEDDKMSVILKQRTCRDDGWKALPDGHADATFLVGPEGGNALVNRTVNMINSLWTKPESVP